MQEFLRLTTAIHKSSDFRISGCKAYTPSKITWPQIVEKRLIGQSSLNKTREP